ncbi:MAG: hybrid sensor histidine kinase/response regulator [Deltaproteobacteria bacterium CG_4_9_14_3_um_filter_63_12]|nr:MAG: hybrid sensor histidine kinase/response regulator [Deltaproteobacteria bacterium CG_4_9_14_3_um_filter_63_12]
MGNDKELAVRDGGESCKPEGLRAGSAQQPVPTVLIVDDTAANLTLLCEIIKRQGYHARPVTSGALALQAASASPPELILLDIAMPGMNGFEVCERLKADPVLKEIPVIFISALTDVEDKVRAFTAGGVDYITKPFRFEEVQTRVTTHLELRRQRRELQASNDRLFKLELLRDNLVHMLVHDLRTPLAVQLGFLGFLKKDPASTLTPQQKDQIEETLNAVKRMVLMVNAMLDLSKLEATKMIPQLLLCDLGIIAQEVVAELSSLAKGRNLVLRPQSLELHALVDRGLISRVFQNLIANALRFAPEDNGQVEVELDRVDQGVRIQVKDNGRGISSAHHAVIFEKFGQVGEKKPREMPSTGLGLPFCKLAVEAHGGRIGVESVVGKGSTFWFVLPDPPALQGG